MYVLKDVEKNAYLGFNGWIHVDDNGVLDLSDVARFTTKEAGYNLVGDRYQWISFGCYQPLDEELN